MTAHKDDKFGTAINCIDGRIQQPVTDWLKFKYSLDYIDVITEPGPTKVLLDDDKALIESIKGKVELSVIKHNSNIIAVVAHHDCAGNSISKEIQCEQIKKSVEIIKGWGYDATVLGLWVDENWNVNVVVG